MRLRRDCPRGRRREGRSGTPVPCGQAAPSPCPPGHLLGHLELPLETIRFLSYQDHPSSLDFLKCPSAFEAFI